MVHQSIKVYARIKRILVKSPRFHKVFNTDTTQPEIFDFIAKPVICSVIEGFNGTVFAYGQTGSGKTFSINGCSKNYSDRGIIPRSIQYIFDHYSNIAEKPTIYISYMEIYNEVGYDLLSTKQRKVARTLEELPRVSLLEDSKGDAHIRNLSVFPVTTEEEAMRLVFMGDTNRTIAETPHNEYSSRSHCIFTVQITHHSGSSKHLRSSKLHLVDLAGSERVYKSHSTGTVLNEAKFINLSLHFLQQVILALSESKRHHIPYRNSMLTHLLKDSLNGNCITTMLATLTMSKSNVQETISTCRFAQRVALITTEPIINEITDPQQEIELLKERIIELQNELSRSIGFKNSSNLSLDQKESCQFEVDSFINSDKKPMVLEPDLTQIQFCFTLLRNELQKKKNELKKFETLISNKNSEIKTLNDVIVKKEEEIESLKNIIDKIPEKPVPLNSCNSNYNLKKQNSLTLLFQKSKEDGLLEIPYDKETFETFMSRPEVAGNLNFYKNALENKLNLAKIYAETIEECKKKITVIRNKLQKQCNLLDKQNLITQLEEQQKIYKNVLLEMKHIQNETNHLEAGLKQAEVRAINKFKMWLEDRSSTSLNQYSLKKEVDQMPYQLQDSVCSVAVEQYPQNSVKTPNYHQLVTSSKNQQKHKKFDELQLSKETVNANKKSLTPPQVKDNSKSPLYKKLNTIQDKKSSVLNIKDSIPPLAQESIHQPPEHIIPTSSTYISKTCNNSNCNSTIYKELFKDNSYKLNAIGNCHSEFESIRSNSIHPPSIDSEPQYNNMFQLKPDLTYSNIINSQYDTSLQLKPESNKPDTTNQQYGTIFHLDLNKPNTTNSQFQSKPESTKSLTDTNLNPVEDNNFQYVGTNFQINAAPIIFNTNIHQCDELNKSKATVTPCFLENKEIDKNIDLSNLTQTTDVFNSDTNNFKVVNESKDHTVIKECFLSKSLVIDEKPEPETEIIDAEVDNNFKEYFKDGDSAEFKEFLKTVSLSGVAEIDEEIVNFYRSKFC